MTMYCRLAVFLFMIHSISCQVKNEVYQNPEAVYQEQVYQEQAPVRNPLSFIQELFSSSIFQPRQSTEPRQTVVAMLTGVFRNARQMFDNFSAKIRQNRRLDQGIQIISDLVDRIVPPSPQRLARSGDADFILDNNAIAKAVAISTFAITGILAL